MISLSIIVYRGILMNDKWYLKEVHDLEKEDRKFKLGEKVWILKRELLDYYELYEYWSPGLIVGYKDINVSDIDIYLVYSHTSKEVKEHYGTVLFKLEELPDNMKCSSDHEFTREYEYYYRVAWSTPRP